MADAATTRTPLGVLTAIAVCLTAWLFAPSAAQAAFGDEFGLSPINDGPGAAQEAPAYPDIDDPSTPDNDPGGAFWAGTCDRSAAPTPGNPIPGGFGSYPTTVASPGGIDFITLGIAYAQVPSPAVPPHCIDWGVPSASGVLPWSQPPSDLSR